MKAWKPSQLTIKILQEAVSKKDGLTLSALRLLTILKSNQKHYESDRSKYPG